MKHLWLDHCVRLASAAIGYLPLHFKDRGELLSRMQIKLSCEEFRQLGEELQGMGRYFNPDAVPTPDKIMLLGVAFVPDSDEYIRELHHSLKLSERSRMHLENIIGMGDRLSRRRLGLGRGVHVAPTAQPGTDRGGPT